MKLEAFKNWCKIQFEKLRVFASRKSVVAWKEFVWWLGKKAPLDSSKLRKELAAAEFDPKRADDLMAFAKESYADAITGFKLANERIEKLIVGVFVACGWIFSTMKQSQTTWQSVLWAISCFAFIFAVTTLLFGRWRVAARVPVEFVDLASRSFKIPSGDRDKWFWSRACQYAIAAHETRQLTGLAHKRLFIAVTSMVIGLVLYALRGV